MAWDSAPPTSAELANIKPSWDSEPPTDEEISKTKPQGFLEKTARGAVNELPVLGGILGGVIGTPADVVAGPMGTVAGAGIGGYLGTSAKNLINSYIDPDNAPKSNTQAILSPMVGGVQQAGMQAGGELLSGGIGALSKPVSDYMAKIAEQRAVAATGATGVQASKFADDAGRQLLDRGLIKFGSSQEQTASRLTDALEASGKDIGDSLKQLDDAGASVPRSEIIAELRKRASALGENDSQMGVANKLNSLADALEEKSAQRMAGLNNKPWQQPAPAPEVFPNSQIQEQMPLPSHKIQPDMFTQETPPGALPSMADLKSTPTASGPEIPGPVPGYSQIGSSESTLLSSEQPSLQLPASPKVQDTMSLSQAEDAKRGFQSNVNYLSSPMETNEVKEAADVYRQKVEDAATQVDPTIAAKFKNDKELYGLLNPIDQAATKRAWTTSQSPPMGLLDSATSGVGAVMGGAPGAIIAPVLRRAIAPRLNSSMAVGADWLGDLVKSSPESLGRWAAPLTQASARGGNSLAATDFVLQQTDPDYSQHMRMMKNAPDDINRSVATDPDDEDN